MPVKKMDFGCNQAHPCPSRGRGNSGAAAHNKQGRLQSVAHSRYARKHKDSHTKPLHDATAQMAVNAQMQRHRRLTTRLGLRPKPLSAFNGDIALPYYISAFVYYKLPLELLFMNLPQPRSPKNSPSLNMSLPLE